MRKIVLQEAETLYREEISSFMPFPGGAAGQCFKLELKSGISAFAKTCMPGQSDRLEAEVQGLEAIRNTGAVRVPAVHGLAGSVLFLEWIETKAPNKQSYAELGRALARLHRSTDGQFGFSRNNYIGITSQINQPGSVSWVEFFTLNRLDFQFNLLNSSDTQTLRRKYDELRPRIPELLAGSEEPPALIHGDFWSGNFLCDQKNEPVLIDPACSYSHREMELGIMRLFGGFPDIVYQAYESESPLSAGADRRIQLYTLYHLINHVNIFGAPYIGGSLAKMEEILRGL